MTTIHKCHKLMQAFGDTPNNYVVFKALKDKFWHCNVTWMRLQKRNVRNFGLSFYKRMAIEKIFNFGCYKSWGFSFPVIVLPLTSLRKCELVSGNLLTLKFFLTMLTRLEGGNSVLPLALLKVDPLHINLWDKHVFHLLDVWQVVKNTHWNGLLGIKRGLTF